MLVLVRDVPHSTVSILAVACDCLIISDVVSVVVQEALARRPAQRPAKKAVAKKTPAKTPTKQKPNGIASR